MLERIINDENLCCYIYQLFGTKYICTCDVKYVKNEDAKNFPFPSRNQRSNVVQPKYFTTENPFQPGKIVSCRRADSEINNLLNVSKSSSV